MKRLKELLNNSVTVDNLTTHNIIAISRELDRKIYLEMIKINKIDKCKENSS